MFVPHIVANIMVAYRFYLEGGVGPLWPPLYLTPWRLRWANNFVISKFWITPKGPLPKVPLVGQPSYMKIPDAT
jgi:hypothetical protein